MASGVAHVGSVVGIASAFLTAQSTEDSSTAHQIVIRLSHNRRLLEIMVISGRRRERNPRRGGRRARPQSDGTLPYSGWKTETKGVHLSTRTAVA